MRRMLKAAAVLWATLYATASMAASCDRACLDKALDRYLAAMVAHKPANAGLGAKTKLTENGAPATTSSGLWRDAKAVGALRRHYLDPESGQAAFYGIIDESAGPAVTMIRIKVRGGKITESEAIAARTGEHNYAPQDMITTAPGEAPVPAAARLSRVALEAAANQYFDALQNHSNVGIAFYPDCLRLENGRKPKFNCVAGFEKLTQISAVTHRRTDLIDVEQGAVVATAMFLRPPGAVRPDGEPWLRNLFLELMLFDTGGVRLASGVMHYLDPSDPETTGWNVAAK